MLKFNKINEFSDLSGSDLNVVECFCLVDDTMCKTDDHLYGQRLGGQIRKKLLGPQNV